MGKFAEGTDVPVEKSESEIRGLLRRYGADEFGMAETKGSALIMFTMQARHVRFRLPLPKADEADVQTRAKAMAKARRWSVEASMPDVLSQELRRRWRALALVIKAKLEAVATGITTFEQEFLAHIVLPNNRTVGESIAPAIAEAYASGKVRPMLPEWSGEPS